MKNIRTIGRILLALPFVIFGINHFIMKDIFIGMLSSFLPNSAYTVFVTGAIMVISGIAIMIGKEVLLFCYILAGLLILFILTIHIPHLIENTNDVYLSLFAMLKDIGLLGGLLVIISLYKEDKK